MFRDGRFPIEHNKILLFVHIDLYSGLDWSLNSRLQKQSDLYGLDNPYYISYSVPSGEFFTQKQCKSSWDYAIIYIQGPHALAPILCLNTFYTFKFQVFIPLIIWLLKRGHVQQKTSTLFEKENIFYLSSYLIRLGPLI